MSKIIVLYLTSGSICCLNIATFNDFLLLFRITEEIDVLIHSNMPRKCCVPFCKSNYKTGESIAVFRFPSDVEQARLWKTAIPRNWNSTEITSNTVVCAKHWPAGFESYQHYGKIRPVNPPSIFFDVPKSCITHVPPKRMTRKCLVENRSIIPDELQEFASSDTLTFGDILEKVVSRISGVTAFEEEVRKSVIVQSTILDNGIPRFVLEIDESLKFTTYHKGVLCTVTTLSRNKIRKISCWSSIEEAVRFLKNYDDATDQKKNVIHEHLHVMGLLIMGCFGKIYPTQMITRCFEYFFVSRALYSRLCKDYQLPSIRTLTRLTSKFSTLGDTAFISKLFGKVPKIQRKCVILLDEVYVKAALRLHGGTVFGKASNDPGGGLHLYEDGGVPKRP